MTFNLNVGRGDRIARIILGVVLLGLPLAGFPWWTAALAVVPLGTAVMGFCPAYAVMRTSTKRHPQEIK